MTQYNNRLKRYDNGEWVPVVVGSPGFTGSRGVDGYIGADGYTGSQGLIGYTGSAGSSVVVGSTGQLLYNNSGSAGATSNITYVSANSALSFSSATSFAGVIETTATTSQVAIASFPISTYSGGKFIVQASQGTARQITEVLVIHDGTTAYATEYATIGTGELMFSLDVDINASNVRILATTTSATSTAYKISANLMLT
jgi:hypothetical protein